MVENIVRHLNRPEEAPRTIVDRIRAAAHEVQRPVFYALPSSSRHIFPSLLCNALKERSSSRWRGLWPSLNRRFDLLDADCTGSSELAISKGR